MIYINKYKYNVFQEEMDFGGFYALMENFVVTEKVIEF